MNNVTLIASDVFVLMIISVSIFIPQKIISVLILGPILVQQIIFITVLVHLVHENITNNR